jgi:hypothetical protein
MQKSLFLVQRRGCVVCWLWLAYKAVLMKQPFFICYFVSAIFFPWNGLFCGVAASAIALSGIFLRLFYGLMRVFGL